MIYELENRERAAAIFAGWQETLIYSCLQKVMGKIYVTDPVNPKAAFAFVGCFGFFAGEPNPELLSAKPDGFTILTPQNEAWARLIEEAFPDAKKVTRYAIKKNTKFDVEGLRANLDLLPEGYEIREIDEEMYNLCLRSPATEDFVSSFDNYEHYKQYGMGRVILRDGDIVAGASSYTAYREGIEIEVDTIESERRKKLATVACSSLILGCLERGLYPSWDAQNMNSVHLAEGLGYEFAHEYTAYEVSRQWRRH